MKKIAFIFSLLCFLPFYGSPDLKQDVVHLLTPKLNSDRIAYFFDSYGVEPIDVPESPFGEHRISNLYSVHGDKKIMRTLAVVEFHQPVHENLQQAHHDISEGKSIGIALRDHGWKLDKAPLYFGTVSLSSNLKAWMHEETSDLAAVHIYKLGAFKENSKDHLHYCTIIEVHSPQYLDENWLQALYPDQYENHREATAQVEGLIDSLSSLIHEIIPQP